MGPRKRSIKTAGMKSLVTLPLSDPRLIQLPMQIDDTVLPAHQAILGDRQGHPGALKHAE